MSKAITLSSLLIDIEAELRQLGLWQAEPPEHNALASQEPFCIDTLSFEQWLQFVFMVKLRQLLDAQQTLPSQCSIAPMAEEHFAKSGRKASGLIGILYQVDNLLSEGEAR